jgi:chromosome segregation ATPase
MTTKSTETIDQLEQEIQTLRRRLEKSSVVLDGLSEVQSQFEDLAIVYRDIKKKSTQLNIDERLGGLERTLGGLREELTTIQRDWQNPRDAVQVYLDTAETRLRNELRAGLSQIEQSTGPSSAHMERIEKLDGQLRALKSVNRETDKRSKMLQNWLIGTTILAASAIVMPFMMPMVQSSTATAESTAPDVAPPPAATP